MGHNVKATYQRYIGWYDGTPAHLWQHPPRAAAERSVQVIGGVEATVRQAQELRRGVQLTPMTAAAGMAPAMTTTQVFDSMAIRINGR